MVDEEYEYQLALYEYKRNLRRRRILSLIYLSRLVKKRPKRFYIRPIFLRRREKGYHENLILEMRLGDQEQFFNFHRMSPSKFDELLHHVGPLISKMTVRRNDVISPAERLCITLRYLAAGDSMGSLSFAFRVSKSTISNLVSETCRVIWVVLKERVFFTPSIENWSKIGQRFFNLWHFPNCIGAIDGKHVVMQAPNKAGSLYYNYKGTNSLVLMAVCDADYCFTLVDIGASGRQSDGGVLRNSIFGQAILQEKLQLPPPKLIPGSNNRVTPHLFVGDAAFPMSNRLMRPFPQRGLTEDKRIFNYRLSRARRIIENTFGIMAAQWRILRKPIIAKLKNVEYIMQGVVCLHNFLQMGDRDRPPQERRYCPRNFIDREIDGTIREGDWRAEVDDNCALRDLGRLGANTYCRSADQTRNHLVDYFMNEGQVPWQRKQAGLED